MSEKINARSLSNLIADTGQQVSSLIRYEIALAKAEVTSQVRGVRASALYVVAAIALGHLALIMGFFTLAYGLAAAGLPTWLGFLIVFLLLLLLVALLLFMAWRRGKKVARSHTYESVKALGDVLPKSESRPSVTSSTGRSATPGSGRLDDDDDDDWIF